jgi:hypothetical protein
VSAPYVKRVLRRAAKAHPCAGCPVEIPKGMDYVDDQVLHNRSTFGRIPDRLWQPRWHLPCAPTREEVMETWQRERRNR